MLFVPPEKQLSILKTFSEFRFIPFNFENAGTGFLYLNEIE
jgi:hypothetical protein